MLQIKKESEIVAGFTIAVEQQREEEDINLTYGEVSC